MDTPIMMYVDVLGSGLVVGAGVGVVGPAQNTVGGATSVVSLTWWAQQLVR